MFIAVLPGLAPALLSPSRYVPLEEVLQVTGISLALDTILLGAGILTALVAWKALRGRFSAGMAIASAGLVLLGVAHLSETLMWLSLDMGADAIELVHRVLVLSGFGWLVYGLWRTGGELREEWQRVLHANAALIIADEDLRLANEELRERNRQLLEASGRNEARRPIRLLIAETNTIVRRALVSLLAEEGDMLVVGEADSAEQAQAAACLASPDAVLVGDSLASRELIGSLNDDKRTRVIVLGTYQASALEALAAGACEYILKDVGHHQLADAIRRAMRGGGVAEVDTEIRS